LSQFSGLETAVVAHRLAGDWQPSETFFSGLLSGEVQDVQISRPYPFFLASPLQEQPAKLGSLEQWQVEWKWDGIRAQLIRRRGEVFLWSRGEELITEQFPELSESALAIDDGTVLDGEILPWQQGKVMPFSALQRRLGRKRLSRKILSEVPVVLLSFDLLEYQGKDIRGWPLRKRRHRLEQLLADVQGSLMVSPVVEISSWQELARRKDTSRERGVEGLMLKDRDSAYLVGRRRGHWWKWKVDPYTVDAVLIYAQRGHGKRATLYTDYTFAVWDEDRLTPFAKAYSGLSDLEIREVDRFVRNNTLDRLGPVRAVRPELVFEIAFDGIRRSRRHKSGLAVRFPRMARWRRDKRAQDADRIESVQELLPEE
jgi:DNA ligase-1